jgi:hypothetical protein
MIMLKKRKRKESIAHCQRRPYESPWTLNPGVEGMAERDALKMNFSVGVNI